MGRAGLSVTTTETGLFDVVSKNAELQDLLKQATGNSLSQRSANVGAAFRVVEEAPAEVQETLRSMQAIVLGAVNSGCRIRVSIDPEAFKRETEGDPLSRAFLRESAGNTGTVICDSTSEREAALIGHDTGDGFVLRIFPETGLVCVARRNGQLLVTGYATFRPNEIRELVILQNESASDPGSGG